jgi:hypothetical protein
MALVGERRERRVLWALVLAPVIVLALFVPLAAWATSDWPTRLIAMGIPLEIAGAWAVFVRPLVEDCGFWLIRQEADKKTKRAPIVGMVLILVGALLQFVSVVFL